jgi:hypothetical protein
MELFPVESSETEDIMILHFKSTTSTIYITVMNFKLRTFLDGAWKSFGFGFVKIFAHVVGGFLISTHHFQSICFSFFFALTFCKFPH